MEPVPAGIVQVSDWPESDCSEQYDSPTRTLTTEFAQGAVDPQKPEPVTVMMVPPAVGHPIDGQPETLVTTGPLIGRAIASVLQLDVALAMLILNCSV